MSDLEQKIANWRTDLAQSQALIPSDLDEMENHLREEVAALQTAGLSAAEAFLVARYRLGETDALATEFRKVNPDGRSLKRLSWMALGAFVYLMAAYVVGVIWNGGIAAAAHYGMSGYTMLAFGIVTKIILVLGAVGLFWLVGYLWLQTESGKRWPALSRFKLALLSIVLVVADLGLIAGQLLLRLAAEKTLTLSDLGRMSLASAYAGMIWTFLAPILMAFLVIGFRARALRHRETDTACPSE